MPRLIDADAVFRWYVETFSEKNIGERAIQPNEIRFSMNDIRDNLYNMPTIEAEPVRHGRWEYKHFSSEPHCSLCLAEYPIETNYCHNCGAKMDGGSKNAIS